jgi:hypothetical protein
MLQGYLPRVIFTKYATCTKMNQMLGDQGQEMFGRTGHVRQNEIPDRVEGFRFFFFSSLNTSKPRVE